jgi:hypothetical protein
MTFDEALNVDNFFTMDIIYGGVAHNYAGLSADQEALFLSWFNDYAFSNPYKVGEKFRLGITSTELAVQAYSRYGHLSPMRYPRVVSLCETTYNRQTLECSHRFFSWPISQLPVTVLNILDHTLDNKIYVYDNKTKAEFRKYMSLELIKKKPNIEAAPLTDTFDSLEVHAALVEIDCKAEDIKYPIKMLNNEHQVDRLLGVASLRAEALAFLIIRG